MSEGYDFCVDDDLLAIGMKYSTDVHVELVKLVDGLRRAYVPQHSVVQNQVVRWVERGAVPLVVVSQVWVVKSQSNLTSLYVINLGKKSTKNIYNLTAKCICIP